MVFQFLFVVWRVIHPPACWADLRVTGGKGSMWKSSRRPSRKPGSLEPNGTSNGDPMFFLLTCNDYKVTTKKITIWMWELTQFPSIYYLSVYIYIYAHSIYIYICIYIYIYWGGAISVFELHALALPIDFKRSSMKTPAVAKWKITNGGCSWFMTNIAMV